MNHDIYEIHMTVFNDLMKIYLFFYQTKFSYKRQVAKQNRWFEKLYCDKKSTIKMNEQRCKYNAILHVIVFF